MLGKGRALITVEEADLPISKRKDTREERQERKVERGEGMRDAWRPAMSTVERAIQED